MTNDSRNRFTIRRVAAGEISLLPGWASAEPVAWIDDSRLHRELNTRNYRPEWSWIAEVDGALVGRALWWGSDNVERPVTLDCLLVRETTVRAEEVGVTIPARTGPVHAQ